MKTKTPAEQRAQARQNLKHLRGAPAPTFKELCIKFCTLPDHRAGPVAARFLGRLEFLLSIRSQVSAAQVADQLQAVLNTEH